MAWLPRIRIRSLGLGLGVFRCCSPPSPGLLLLLPGKTRPSPGLPLPHRPAQWCAWGQFRPAARYYSTLPPSTELRVQYRYGRPMLSLPLPSRAERCVFWLRPMLTTVDHFLSDIRREDPGVTTTAVLTTDGEKVCSSTSMDTLLNKDFLLLLNNNTYTVHSTGRESHEHMSSVEDMKTVVHMLHSALNLPQHQQVTQTHLLLQLDTLTRELAPLEKARARMARRAESHAMRVAWAGLAFLSLQGGFLAYLTWFVFAWDVMEPVTYFITYGTSMGFFAYYILTKQDLVYPDAKDRQFLHFFHQRAAKDKFNIARYNQLRDQLATVESDLKRLRNPIQLHLPVDQVSTKT